jgi:hypothetical protein
VLARTYEDLNKLVTRLRAKKFKKVFNALLQDIWTKMNFKKILNNK